MGQNCSFCAPKADSEGKDRSSSRRSELRESKVKDLNRAQYSCDEYSNRMRFLTKQTTWPNSPSNDIETESESHLEITSPPTFGPEGRDKFLMLKEADKGM